VELAIFYTCAAIAVLSALMVVLQRRAVYSALSLIVCFIAIALLFFQLGAYFIAAIQVIVYAGAIMVLFLFVVMLIDPVTELFPVKRAKSLGLFGVPLALIFGLLLYETVSETARPGLPAVQGDIRSIAVLLFNDYLLPFEVTSILILIAVLGAMVLAKGTD